MFSASVRAPVSPDLQLLRLRNVVVLTACIGHSCTYTLVGHSRTDLWKNKNNSFPDTLNKTFIYDFSSSQHVLFQTVALTTNDNAASYDNVCCRLLETLSFVQRWIL